LEGYVSKAALGFIDDEFQRFRTFGFAKEDCGPLPPLCKEWMTHKIGEAEKWQDFEVMDEDEDCALSLV